MQMGRKYWDGGGSGVRGVFLDKRGVTQHTNNNRRKRKVPLRHGTGGKRALVCPWTQNKTTRADTVTTPRKSTRFTMTTRATATTARKADFEAHLDLVEGEDGVLDDQAGAVLRSDDEPVGLGTDGADERHHHLLTDGVDRRVGDLVHNEARNDATAAAAAVGQEDKKKKKTSFRERT